MGLTAWMAACCSAQLAASRAAAVLPSQSRQQLKVLARRAASPTAGERHATLWLAAEKHVGTTCIPYHSGQ